MTTPAEHLALTWTHRPFKTNGKGRAILAPLSVGGPTELDGPYVISHRHSSFAVSFRPPGTHEHVGTCGTLVEALDLADNHWRGIDREALLARMEAEIARIRRVISMLPNGAESRDGWASDAARAAAFAELFVRISRDSTI